MPVVTGVYRQKGLVRLWADGRCLCSIDEKTFDSYALSEGDAIDPDEYLDRLAAVQCKRAYEQALSMLDRCARSEKQILDALSRRGIVPGAARAAVNRLRENRVLDDQALARRFVELQTEKPVGRCAIRQKLRQKGISEEDAEAALDTISDQMQSEAALEIARKLYPRYEGQPLRAARAKLGQALARRGFGWDDIGRALESIFSPDTD